MVELQNDLQPLLKFSADSPSFKFIFILNCSTLDHLCIFFRDMLKWFLLNFRMESLNWKCKVIIQIQLGLWQSTIPLKILVTMKGIQIVQITIPFIVLVQSANISFCGGKKTTNWILYYLRPYEYKRFFHYTDD